MKEPNESNGGIVDYFHSDVFAIKRASQDDISEIVELINHAFQYQNEAKGTN